MLKSAVFGAILSAASIALFAATANAQTTLELINEYPASSITGEADAFFADTVKTRTGGRIVIRLLPNAESKLRTHEQLKAVTEGRFAMATSFGGALAAESPTFLMSSLPFVTPTTRDQRALYEAARTQYEALFAERKQKLLYVVPWPASGIWSATPLAGAETLKALKIRTYDKTSTDVLAKVAASATLISFNDLNAKLESGELNAVLSSGDGGAGRRLVEVLAQFFGGRLRRALELHVDLARCMGQARRGVAHGFRGAARETYARQWPLLDARVAQNYARMRENGVTIDENPPAGVMAALHAAADTTVADWQSRASPDARRVFEAYRAQRR